jgi:hypothetical protein
MARSSASDTNAARSTPPTSVQGEGHDYIHCYINDP